MADLLYFRKTSPTATQPTKAHQDDAGFDLYVSRPADVVPGALVEIHTDLQIQLPPCYWAHLLGRSSTPRRYGLHVIDAVIDGGYRGELFIAVRNLGYYTIKVEPGMRLAQIIPHKIDRVMWVEKEALSPSSRGEGGFGSSGV